LESLLERMNYCLQLYYLFFKCDTQSGDKTQAPLKWFEKTIEGRRPPHQPGAGPVHRLGSAWRR
ncbi:MAG: hypothetical protein J0M02_19550, partial [Planctomycetes bacterium]|nr:hypothetical protein [Planctomycetota bacterium]